MKSSAIMTSIGSRKNGRIVSFRHKKCQLNKSSEREVFVPSKECLFSVLSPGRKCNSLPEWLDLAKYATLANNLKVWSSFWAYLGFGFCNLLWQIFNALTKFFIVNRQKIKNKQAAGHTDLDHLQPFWFQTQF